MYFAQQGDCLIKETKIPVEAQKILTQVLIESQVTHHAHRVTGKAEVLKQGETLYIRAVDPFDVVHEEHKTLTIPAGEYFIDHVQEYDHLTEEARAVAD